MDKVTLEEFKKDYPDISDEKLITHEQFNKDIKCENANSIFYELFGFKLF